MLNYQFFSGTAYYAAGDS